MPRTLDVYLHKDHVGVLIQDEHGRMGFQYREAWLNNPESVPLSHSLPLREDAFSRDECRGFFAGLLPEETQRELIAKNLGISARNDYAMIAEIGGECAGAITFLPVGQPLEAQPHEYRSLTSQELADLIRQLPRRPLLAGEEGIRLSLAGAQSKIAVHVANGKNFSLLYEGSTRPTPQIRLAPFYDLLSTAFYPDLSKRMAMKIGSEYRPDHVLPRHFDQLAEEAGLSKVQVRRRLASLAELMVARLAASPDFAPDSQLVEFIKTRAQKALGRL